MPPAPIKESRDFETVNRTSEAGQDTALTGVYSIRQTITRLHTTRRDRLPSAAQLAQRQACRLGFFEAVAVLINRIIDVDRLAIGLQRLQRDHTVCQRPATRFT